ncbi:MAG TPA: nitroreductase family protein [Dehalococcoidia bacterium]|nr:nitroreductase family protein [Dehalococcoidia bacterium]HLB28569.1 nitroreductase family protein [Dehalococcoidia bacterium]
MDIDSFLDLAQRRRSIRRFKPDPVPDEHVDKVLEATRWAASGANSQPWDFVVVKDPEQKKAIADIFVEAGRHSREVDKRFPFGPDAHQVEKLVGAPVLIAVCGDPRFKEFYPLSARRDQIFYVSLGAAMQQLHLAAAALGLASCWGTVNEQTEAGLKGLLGIPAHMQVLEVFSLGYPAYVPGAGYRRDLAAMTHKGRFDAARMRTDADLEELMAKRARPDIYSSVRDGGARGS